MNLTTSHLKTVLSTDLEVLASYPGDLSACWSAVHALLAGGQLSTAYVGETSDVPATSALVSSLLAVGGRILPLATVVSPEYAGCSRLSDNILVKLERQSWAGDAPALVLGVDLLPLIRCCRRKSSTPVWPILKTFMEQNAELCSGLGSRWIVSLAECYADCGEAGEKQAGMIVSLLGLMEKLFLTVRCGSDITIRAERQVAWTDTLVPMCPTPNTPLNTVCRLGSVLEHYPTLALFAKELLAKQEKAENSLWGMCHKICKFENLTSVFPRIRC